MWIIRKIVSKGDYNYAVVPEHPKATKRGYVLEHRIIVENFLKRLLKDNEVVHHVNMNKKDNQLSNLEVMDKKLHLLFHALKHRKTFCLIECPYCNKKFIVSENQTFKIKTSYKLTFCSRECSGKFHAEYKFVSDEELENIRNKSLINCFKLPKYLLRM